MSDDHPDYVVARDLIRRAEASGTFDVDDDPHALRDAIKRLHGNSRGAVEALRAAKPMSDHNGLPVISHGWVTVYMRPDEWATLDRFRGQ